MKITFIYLPSTVFLAKRLKRAINWLEDKKQQQQQQKKKKQWNLYVEASLQTPIFFPNLSSIVGRFSCKRPLDTWSDVYVRARGM